MKFRHFCSVVLRTDIGIGGLYFKEISEILLRMVRELSVRNKISVDASLNFETLLKQGTAIKSSAEFKTRFAEIAEVD